MKTFKLAAIVAILLSIAAALYAATAPTFTVTRSVSFTIVSTGAISPQSDGSTLIPIVLQGANGLSYKADLWLQADGVTWHDVNGATIASPPAALGALATATTNYMSKQQAAIAAPGVQTLLQAYVP